MPSTPEDMPLWPFGGGNPVRGIRTLERELRAAGYAPIDAASSARDLAGSVARGEITPEELFASVSTMAADHVADSMRARRR